MSGPTTPAGKARSRMNAVKHGLRAIDEIFLARLSHRERAIHGELRETLHREFRPQSSIEKSLVDRLAIQYFRLYRLYDLENIAYACTVRGTVNASRASAPLDPLASAIPHLDRFARYDGRIERQIRLLYNSLRLLYIGRGDNSLNFFPFKN